MNHPLKAVLVGIVVSIIFSILFVIYGSIIQNRIADDIRESVTQRQITQKPIIDNYDKPKPNPGSQIITNDEVITESDYEQIKTELLKKKIESE